jgi:ABC-type spermidine/putrescine transport system permease subunit II
LEGLAIENLGIFYGLLVYFTAIGNILWPFGIFCGHLVYFFPFWYFVPRKIWQPWLGKKIVPRS